MVLLFRLWDELTPMSPRYCISLAYSCLRLPGAQEMLCEYAAPSPAWVFPVCALRLFCLVSLIPSSDRALFSAPGPFFVSVDVPDVPPPPVSP